MDCYRSHAGVIVKPVMLYTLPRTRASAMLYCCRRPIIKDEVFSSVNLNSNNETEWNDVLYKITDPKTVLKIHGSHIAYDNKIQEWYQQVIDQSVYEIFIIERPDRLNTFLSLILASKFGFSKREEIEPFYFTVTDNDIQSVRTELTTYLSFYPRYGTAINIDNMPTEYFNTDIMRYENQHSHLKYQYIENYQWTVEQLELILKEFQKFWDDKIHSLVRMYNR